MIVLGTDVDRVRFTSPTPGRDGQILVDFKDGSFKLFTLEGALRESSGAVGASNAGTSALPAAPPLTD